MIGGIVRVLMEKIIKEGQFSFQTEGRLLQELGERLVASPEVALVELIKNSYDADATYCEVRWDEKEKILIVQDDGSGMTLEAFKSKWMRIATTNKLENKKSEKYERE